MTIVDFEIIDGLSVDNGLPKGRNPVKGDVWISKDKRLIVITKIDAPSFGNISYVHAYVNGKYIQENVEWWPMILLSMQASPVGRVRTTI